MRNNNKDGWTLLPQLPNEAGDYVLLYSGKGFEGERYCSLYTEYLTPWLVEHIDECSSFRQDSDGWWCIGWMKVDVPNWWKRMLAFQYIGDEDLLLENK